MSGFRVALSNPDAVNVPVNISMAKKWTLSFFIITMFEQSSWSCV